MKNRIALTLLILVPILALAPNLVLSQEHTESSRKILTKVTPQYPDLARTMRIQGTVRADVLVAPNGAVKSLEVRGGHPLLAQSAQIALRQWKWEPAPHETHESVELRFTP
jgi:TonB family protein